MPSAADDLRAAIAAAGGALRFDEYLDVVLYGPDGFYSTTGRAGRRGDFLTSPEVGPLFGTVVARFLDAEWARLGRPDGFTVVEVGAGPGTLARSVIAAAPEFLARGTWMAVETSEAQRASHPDSVVSLAEMPEYVDVGVVFANELLDNLAFRMFVHDDGWREAHVVVDGDRFAEVLLPTAVPAFLPERAAHGARVPVQERAGEWLGRSLGLLGRGSVVAIDYCTALTVEVAAMPWREWLRTYAGHERGVHWLRNVGAQDITAQVCIDQLALVREPDAVRTQAQWLRLWGIDDLVAEGKRIWAETASAPTLASMRMRSRVSESEALLDPSGLGAFTVLEWRVG